MRCAWTRSAAGESSNGRPEATRTMPIAISTSDRVPDVDIAGAVEHVVHRYCLGQLVRKPSLVDVGADCCPARRTACGTLVLCATRTVWRHRLAAEES